MSMNSQTFLRSVCGIAWIGICVSVAIPQEPDRSRPEPSLAISIAVPGRVGDSAARPIFAFDRTSRFHVILTNKSREPLRLADPLSEQGRAALTFEFVDDKGNRTTARRPPNQQEFRRASLTGSILKPGESVVLEVDFLNADDWTGFPKLPGYGDSLPVPMRALFEIQPDGETKEHGFWTGRAATELETFTFESRISGESRAIGGIAETGNTFGAVQYRIEAEGPEGELTLKRVTVSSGGREMQVPAEAVKGIEKPLLKTQTITVEDDPKGGPVLYVSFDLGAQTSEKGALDTPRVSYAFQNGQFLKRLTSVSRRHVIEEWPAK